MAMGWDDALMLMLAAAGTASSLNPPENKMQTTATGQAPGASQMGQSPLAPQPAAPAAPGGIQPLNAQPLQQLASQLATTGSPPAQVAPLPTTKSNEQMGPPSPSEDPLVGKPADSGWASLLAASPQALAGAAALLGMGQTDNRQVAAPIAGGSQSGNAPIGMPAKRPSIGDILSSIRMR